MKLLSPRKASPKAHTFNFVDGNETLMYTAYVETLLMKVNLSERLLSFTLSLAAYVPLYRSMAEMHLSESREFLNSSFE